MTTKGDQDARTKRLEAWKKSDELKREIRYRAMINEGLRIRRSSQLLSVALAIAIVIGPGQSNMLVNVLGEGSTYEIMVFFVWIAIAYKTLVSVICYDETANGLPGPREMSLNALFLNRDYTPSLGSHLISSIASILRAGVPHFAVVGVLLLAGEVAWEGFKEIVNIENWYAFARLREM